MKRFVLVVLVLGVVWAIAACAPAAPAPPTAAPPTAAPTQPTAAPAQPTAAPAQPTAAPAQPTAAPAQPTAAPSAGGKIVKVGMLTDNSGALAIYGPMLERGFQLGLEYSKENGLLEGCDVQVTIKDTASKPDVGTQAARDLIEQEGVDLLVGAPNSGVTLAVAEIAKNNKKILIAQPAASPDLTGKAFNPYVFRTSRTSVQDALTMGAALTKLGNTFVQIAPDYAFGYGSAAGFYNVIKANGGTFVTNDTSEKSGAIFIPQDTKDFTPYLQKVLDSKAEVVVVTWAGAGFVPLFQQMQQLGIFDKMVVGTGIGDNQTLKAGYADALNSVGVNVYHYALPKNAVNDWLVAKHKEKFGTPPDLFTEGGFTAAQMVAAGLKATGCDAAADKLIPIYEKLSFDGPKGKYSVRASDHVMLQPMYLVKLNNVTDPDFKFLELVQELSPEDTAPPCALEGDYKSRCGQ